MGSLDDLHTLIRLLKKYELPVSPILEYAIKEKEEALCAEKTHNDRIIPTEQELKTNNVFVCESIIQNFSTYLYIVRSDKIAREYLWYIDIPIRRLINKYVDPDANTIYSYHTVEDAESCISVLKLKKEFINDDIRYRNGLSTALTYYINFLRNNT